MNREELDAMWSDSANWRFYRSIYRCARDPRVFVKKRSEFGWTVNFGHRAGWPVFLLLPATILLPFALPVLWRDDRTGVATALVLAALVVAIRVAIGIRNERGD